MYVKPRQGHAERPVNLVLLGLTMLSRAKPAATTLACGLLFVLLLACTPGVSGKWLVKAQDAAIAQERASAVLRSEGFTQWTPSEPPRDGTRFFAHPTHRAIAAHVRATTQGVEVGFGETGTNSVTDEGARVFLSLQATLRNEFGPVNVETLQTPRGVRGTNAGDA